MKTTTKILSEIKLTPKQNAVIYCLQNGWMIITSNDVKGADIAGKKMQFHINGGLFWKLVKLGLIHQGNWEDDRFRYVLTKAGKEIKTKKVEIEIN